MTWRLGRHYPDYHVYEGDTPGATAVGEGVAAQIVADHNGVPLALRPLYWHRDGLCIVEGGSQIAMALTLEFADRIVFDHNARLEVTP
jgi:hypothetical protein